MAPLNGVIGHTILHKAEVEVPSHEFINHRHSGSGKLDMRIYAAEIQECDSPSRVN